MTSIFTILIETDGSISKRDVSDIVHECMMDLPEPEFVRLLDIIETKIETKFIPRDLNNE